MALGIPLIRCVHKYKGPKVFIWVFVDKASFPSVAGTETAQRKTLAHHNLT